MAQARSLRIAVVGCAHGELDKMYATIRHINQSENAKIELLLCCGDFQAVRNEQDLESLACPPKYRSMNTFWKYYSGQETPPCPTIFIGGNHEASNYMWELFYGGWVAPNIFYLGAAGVVQFGGLKIGGLSGIYKRNDYNSGHFERPPFNEDTKRSIYHVRDYEFQKLMQYSEAIDIFMSHDWPKGIAHCGDLHTLLRYKGFLRQEIETNTLGSEPANKLLTKLKPSYWFSAHLHVKFAAAVQHPDDGKVTKFLALDKCLPGRGFLQVLDVPVAADAPLEISFDKEWLAITRAYHTMFPLKRCASIKPCSDLQAHRDWLESKIAADPSILTPPPFQRTAPAYNPSGWDQQQEIVEGSLRSPQTEAFLNALELPYLLDADAVFPAPQGSPAVVDDPNEIVLDFEEENVNAVVAVPPPVVAVGDGDPNEIPLEDEDD